MTMSPIDIITYLPPFVKGSRSLTRSIATMGWLFSGTILPDKKYRLHRHGCRSRPEVPESTAGGLHAHLHRHRHWHQQILGATEDNDGRSRG